MTKPVDTPSWGPSGQDPASAWKELIAPPPSAKVSSGRSIVRIDRDDVKVHSPAFWGKGVSRSWADSVTIVSVSPARASRNAQRNSTHALSLVHRNVWLLLVVLSSAVGVWIGLGASGRGSLAVPIFAELALVVLALSWHRAGRAES